MVQVAVNFPYFKTKKELYSERTRGCREVAIGAGMYSNPELSWGSEFVGGDDWN